METFSSKEILYLSLKFAMVGGKVRIFRIDSNEYPLPVCLSLENELTVSDEELLCLPLPIRFHNKYTEFPAWSSMCHRLDKGGVYPLKCWRSV